MTDFQGLYREYQGPLQSFISRRVDDPEAARDLVQEVFLKAYRFRESYDPAYPVSGWLFGIARNTVHDWHRGRRHEDCASLVESEIASPLPSAEAMLERRSGRESLRLLWKGLTRLQRRVIWMRFIRHRSYAEIAAKLGASLSSIKCAAYRARLALGVSGLELAKAQAEGEPPASESSRTRPGLRTAARERPRLSPSARADG